MVQELVVGGYGWYLLTWLGGLPMPVDIAAGSAPLEGNLGGGSMCETSCG